MTISNKIFFIQKKKKIILIYDGFKKCKEHAILVQKLKIQKICQFTAPDASFVASLKTPEKFIGIIKKYTKICRLLLMYALKFNMYLFYI